MATNAPSATGKVIGFVRQVIGEVTATGSDGVIRVLQVGDLVFADERIETGELGSIEIAFNDGGNFTLGRNAQGFLDADVYQTTSPEDASEYAASIEAIQQAILMGEDPAAIQEASAAGPGAAAIAGNEGTSFITVERTGNQTTPESGFKTEVFVLASEQTEDSAQFVNLPPSLDLDGNDNSQLGVGYRSHYVENDGPLPIADVDIQVANPDDTFLESARIVLTNAQVGDQLDVSVVTRLGVEVDSSVPGVITVTLIGTATPQAYAEAIRSIGIFNASEDPDTTPRVIEVTVNDGEFDSNTAISTITVQAINDPPVVDLDTDDTTDDGYDYLTTFTEGDAAIAITDIDPSVSDVDDQVLQSALVTLTNPQAGDILDFGIMPSGLTAVITGNSIAISGEGSQVDYQNAIRAVTFENISENPSAEIRIIHVTVNDGELNSEIAIARIEVQGVNDVAELDLDGNDSSASGNGYETTFIEDGVAVSITDNDVVIVDVDDENIESATIVLTNPQALDVLSVGGLSIGITATVIGNTVTLTGTASLSAYEQALQAVRFSNTSDDPTTVDRLLNITLNDGDGNSGTAITIIHVTPVNDPPDAINDAVSTLEDTPVSITVLGNDSDPEGDPLSVTSHTQPANGTLVQNANGSFLYTPNVGFFGMDIFTYTISDGNGGTDTATVTVTVDAVADAPMAVDDNVGTDEDTPVTVDVLSNDSDPDGDVLTISGVTQGTNGSVTIDMMSGNPVYMPNLNFSGTDTFTYTISDGNGGTDTATVTVTVGAVGDAPVAVDDNVGTNEDTPVTVDVLSNDSDPDGDVFSISGVTQGMNGTVNIDLVSGNPIYTPNPNFSGVDNFTYTIDDGNGGTDTATVFVTVGAVADTPGFTVTPSSFSSSVDFESVDLGTRSWGSADVSSVGDGNWRTDNPGGRIEVGQETVYLRNNVRDNQVIELEYNRNNDSNLYTDVAAREGDVYALNFDYSARSGATNHSAIDLFWEGQLIATIDTHSVGLQSFNFNLLASATGNSRLELRAVDRNSVGGVLDNISVDLQQNTGYENNILNLPDMFGSLIDTDGSESLTYAINGIPDGAILTDGIHTFTSAAGATQAEVTAWDLSNLQLTPPPDYNGGLTLGYLVTATEASNGNQATRIEDVQLTILPANGDPVMDPNEQLVFNPASALIDGGDGIDTLLVSDNDDLDFSGISNIRNIERIDLTAGDHDISNLSVADVLTMTDGDNLLEILGDVSDNVELTNDWHATGNTLTQNGHQFAEFNNADDSVTLLIEDQVNVTIV